MPSDLIIEIPKTITIPGWMMLDFYLVFGLIFVMWLFTKILDRWGW